MSLRHLIARNGQKTGEPCFGSEQVVVRGVGPTFLDVVSDRHQMPRRVIQKAEIHVRQSRDPLGEIFQLLNPMPRLLLGGRKLMTQLGESDAALVFFENYVDLSLVRR